MIINNQMGLMMRNLVFDSIASTLPSLDEPVCAGVLMQIHPLEQLAWATLELHPHFRGRSRCIEIRYRDGRLSLSGRLPSFFLKQLAQEALRQLDGVETIENQIVVARPSGHLESPDDIGSINSIPKELTNHERKTTQPKKAR